MIYVRHPLEAIYSFSSDCAQRNEYQLRIIQRIAKASLPIVSLYEPIEKSISVSSNGYYFLRNIFEILQHPQEASVNNFFKITYSSVALASSIYKLPLGKAIILLATTMQNARQVHELYFAQEYALILENLVKTGINGLSLFLLINSSLEVMLALATLQMSLALFQVYKEGTRGRYIEAGAQVIMSLVYAKTTVDRYNSISCRDALIEKYGNLIQDILLGKKLTTQRQSLSNLQSSFIKNRIISKDSDGKEYDFGSYFHGFGKQFVKGNNIAIKEIKLHDQEHFQLEFKVNQVFRDRVKERIENIKAMNPTDMQSLLSCLQCRANNITVVKTPNLTHTAQTNLLPTTLIADNLGVVQLGVNSEFPNLQDKVIIQIKADQNIGDCIELTSLIGLPEVLSVSLEQDIERLKIGCLFRNFFPKEATKLERSIEFFELPIDELKTQIITTNPKMETIFNQYLPKISPENIFATMSRENLSKEKNELNFFPVSIDECKEIIFSIIENMEDIVKKYFFENNSFKVIPGKIRYKINGFSQEIYDAGGRSLMAAVTGNHQPFERIASILKLGMLSTELREDIQLNSKGLSPHGDWLTGGADSIYTQLITKKDYGKSFDQITCYNSDVRLLIDLEALELGSYQYLTDMSGIRGENPSYLNRSDIISITKSLMENRHNDIFSDLLPLLMNDRSLNGGKSDDGLLDLILSWIMGLGSFIDHEIMLKDTINPKFFRGIIVPNQHIYDELTKYLRSKNIIDQDTNGSESIFNQPLSSFIRIGNKITEKLVA